MQLSSIQDLTVMMLKDLHSAETQLLGALPQLIGAVSSEAMRDGLMKHTRETESHVERLLKVLAKMGEQPGGRHNKVAEALLAEAKELARMSGEADVKDAALLAAQQKFEHNEIAAYGTAVTFANMLGDSEAAKLLAQTLDEEKRMDEQLNRLAKQKVNPNAVATAPVQ